MVTMEQLQAYLRESAQEDASRRQVTAQGSTLEEALREAATELAMPIRKLEYDLVQQGSSGVLGIGKKPFIILAYPAAEQAILATTEEDDALTFTFDADRPVDRDGAAYVRMAPEGVLLKIVPPTGNGVPVTERDTMTAINRRISTRIEGALVSKIIKQAGNEWVRVADYNHDPMQDAYVNCELIENDMKAVITITPPGNGGADPSLEGIRASVEIAGVSHGLLLDVIQDIEDHPRYRERLVVAEGTPPVNGANGRMVYMFKTGNEKAPIVQTPDGRVDFKEVNRIENVVQGQVVAKVADPKPGVSGMTVTGEVIPATDGKPITPAIGNNTHLSDDGRAVIADMNGQVKLVQGKVTVEPVYVVNGDVNVKEGNIRFLGTVVVNGNVEDGFSITAAGDIEVMGSVSRCQLEAEGDVIVHQGIAGKGDGSVTAGGNIWAKFIENAKITAGDLVVVSDGIINSTVFADHRIICRGKRASIVGGHVRASEEVDAKNLGSVAGSETLVEVGYDPKSRERLLELEARDAELAKEVDEITLNITTVETMRAEKKKITPERLKQYAILRKRREKINAFRGRIAKEVSSIQAYLEELKVNGRISVSGIVYPGVKVAIKDAQLQIRRETKSVTYVFEAGLIKVTRYEESTADITIHRRDYKAKGGGSSGAPAN